MKFLECSDFQELLSNRRADAPQAIVAGWFMPNGEPVGAWDYERYCALLKSASKVTYTFLNAAKEQEHEVPVFDLVP